MTGLRTAVLICESQFLCRPFPDTLDVQTHLMILSRTEARLSEGTDPKSRKSQWSAHKTKQLPFFDDVRHLWRHHDFPGAVAGPDVRQHVPRENGQESVVVVANGLNKLIFQKIGVKMAEVGCDLEIPGGDDGAGNAVLKRVHIKPQIILKQSAKRFQDAAFKISVIFLLKQLAQARHAHHNADEFFGGTEKIGGQPEITRVVGDEHGLAKGSQQIDTIEKILVIYHAAVVGEIAQRHFHQDHDFFALHPRFLHELRLGAI